MRLNPMMMMMMTTSDEERCLFPTPSFLFPDVASVVGGLIECVATDGNTTTVCLSLSQSIIHHQHERELNEGWLAQREREGSHSRDDDDDPQISFFDTIQPPSYKKGSGVCTVHACVYFN